MRLSLIPLLAVPVALFATNQDAPTEVVLHAARVSPDTIELRRFADGSRPAVPLRVELDELPGFPAGSEVVQVEADAGDEDGWVLLALALRNSEQDEVGYHFLLGSRAFEDEASWTFSEPIFHSRGEAYRIVDVLLQGGDGAEITFRRGSLLDGKPLDELVFADTCAVVPKLVEGKSRLIEARGGDALAFGTLR